MAFGAVAGLSDPLEDYPGQWIKFYEQGTTTPLAMAIDSSGVTTVAKAEISSGGTVPVGFIKTVGDVIFVPWVDDVYDLYLFPTEAEADANDTSNAIKLADNLTTAAKQAAGIFVNFDTVELLIANTVAKSIGTPALTQGFRDPVTGKTSKGGSSWTCVNTGGVSPSDWAGDINVNGLPITGQIEDNAGNIWGVNVNGRVNVMSFGAYNDRTNTTTTTKAIQNTITFCVNATFGTKTPTVFIPSGLYSLEDLGSGYALTMDPNGNGSGFGTVIEGDGMWNTSLDMFEDTKTAIKMNTESGLANVKSYMQIRNLRLLGSATLDQNLTSVAIDSKDCPNAVFENVYIDNFGTGLITQNSFNSTYQEVLIFNCTVFPFDIRSNTNDSCFLNCVGEGLPAFSPTHCMKIESSHGVSIKGGAWENCDFAFSISASEITIDTYVEKCALGIIDSIGADTKTQINILNMYSFNNAEALPLFHMSAGTIIVNQLNDSPTPSTVSGSVFALTGGAKAFYGLLNIQTATTLGTFDRDSAGQIRPIFEAPRLETISGIFDAGAARTEYMARVFRPWKVQTVHVHVISGIPSGAKIEIGNTTDPDSIASYTLTNDAFQSLVFPTEIFQTTGAYTNQAGALFLTCDGLGGTSEIQVVFSYYNGFNGNSPLPNINQPDDYIDDTNAGPAPMSLQFID